MPSTEVLVFAPLIVLLAYLIFGISGFGSTLIAVPLLAHILPLKFVIPVIVVLDCVGAFSMGFKLRASVWKAEFLPLLPFLVVGLLIGAFVLMNLSTQWLFAGLGIFVVIFGAYYTIDRKSMMRVPRWVGAPLGIIAGITSSAFGVGGPSGNVHLLRREPKLNGRLVRGNHAGAARRFLACGHCVSPLRIVAIETL